MDSAPHGHAAYLTQNNTTDKAINDISTSEPFAKTRPAISNSTIDTHFAELAREKSCPSSLLSSTASERAREVYVNRHLVDQFRHKFGMSDSHAKAAVEEEMKRRYAPNPWDAPGPRRLKPQRIPSVGSSQGERCPESKEVLRYSEEEWDLFERVLGYK
ncbi:MAG: hypothetical protein Q9161_000790 [Pseudevernia consocians]